MDAALVGRDAILAEARQTLAAGVSVLLEGDAGIGKTAVWRSLVAGARQTGWLVLTCAPTEAEAALPFAALADLLRPLQAEVAALPSPQRAAADAVLLAADPDEAVDERAIGAATRSLLERATGPVLVAVDDLPWLDRPSQRALRFALRRLSPRPAALVSCRPPPDIAALDLDDARRIALTPLGVGALHHVIRARLGATLSRPLLARIARDAGGNPLLAIELARAVLRLPRPPRPGEDLPVAASMQQLLTETTKTLPDPTQAAVRLAALLTVPTVDDLVAAGAAPTALDAAEDAGLLTVTGAQITFAHPVYASAVRAGIPAATRRRLHRALADAVADPDERARQLARCTTRADAAVAAELAAAAERHRARGAPAVAADLYDQAAALTPPALTGPGGELSTPGPSAPTPVSNRPAARPPRRDEADARRVAAVSCRFESGDYAAAGAAADDAAAQLTGDARAEALLLRAMVAWSTDDINTAVAAAGAGLASASAGSPLAGRIHAHLSLFHDSPDGGRFHAQAAIDSLSGEGGDRPLLCSALLHLFFHEVRAGVPPRVELLDRALRLEDGAPSWLAGTVPAVWWKGIDDHNRARSRLLLLLDHAVVRGEEPWQHEILTHLGETELLAGRFADAARHIAAARELGEQLGTGLVGETWLGGILDAYRGDLASAAAVATAGVARAREQSDQWAHRIHLQLAGLVALSRGHLAEAAGAYGELAHMLGARGVVEPLAQRFEPDWIEACVGAGDLDTAAGALARLAARHERLPRPWTTLGLARSRVLLDAAAGSAPDLSILDEARASVPAATLPLDRARCLLVAGMAHRRARRRREAREALDAAIAEFTAIGAAAFADRARAELARISGRAATATDLTPTELRVARLAGQGQTNRAIADALFISPKTVEANLARAYRKLGITNRAQLAATILKLGS